MPFDYATSPYPIPDRIPPAHRRTWERLAAPGQWWTGTERVGIAAAVRAAEDCSLCHARKDALSAAAVEGDHDSDGMLPASAVEAVHHIVTDSARLHRAWFDGLLDAGLEDAAYVELVGVITSVLSIDDLHRGLGLPLEPLPAPQPGDPERRRPSGAAAHGSWVDTVPAVDQLDPADADIYGGMPHAPNVIAALSLVPNEVRTLLDLGGAHYLSLNEMRDFPADRDLSRAAIELVAARVSALNECFY